jgi:hypothetical protein
VPDRPAHGAAAGAGAARRRWPTPAAHAGRNGRDPGREPAHRDPAGAGRPQAPARTGLRRQR